MREWRPDENSTLVVRVDDGRAALGHVTFEALLHLHSSALPFELRAHALRLRASAEDTQSGGSALLCAVTTAAVRALPNGPLDSSLRAAFNISGAEATHRLLTRLVAGNASWREIALTGQLHPPPGALGDVGGRSWGERARTGSAAGEAPVDWGDEGAPPAEDVSINVTVTDLPVAEEHAPAESKCALSAGVLCLGTLANVSQVELVGGGPRGDEAASVPCIFAGAICPPLSTSQAFALPPRAYQLIADVTIGRWLPCSAALELPPLGAAASIGGRYRAVTLRTAPLRRPPGPLGCASPASSRVGVSVNVHDWFALASSLHRLSDGDNVSVVWSGDRESHGSLLAAMVPTMPADEFAGNSSAPPLLSFSLPFSRPVALFNHSSPMEPMELTGTSPAGASLTVHVQVNSPVPVRIRLPQPQVDVFLRSADWAARARADRARARGALGGEAGWEEAEGADEEDAAAHVVTARLRAVGARASAGGEGEGDGGEPSALVLWPGPNNTFALSADLLAYLGAGCAAAHCFAQRAVPPLECVPCAVSHFIYLAAFQLPMPLDVVLTLAPPTRAAAPAAGGGSSGGDGGGGRGGRRSTAAALRALRAARMADATGAAAAGLQPLAPAEPREGAPPEPSEVVALARLELFSGVHAGSDVPSNLASRSTGFFAAQAQAHVLAPVFDQMIHVGFDIWATIEKTTRAGAKPFVELGLSVTNPLSFALNVGEVRASAWLRDTNGVPAAHDAPLRSLLGSGYAPSDEHLIVADVRKSVNETVPINGTSSAQAVSALVSWETLSRIVDEAYVRARLCLKIGDGLIAAELGTRTRDGPQIRDGAPAPPVLSAAVASSASSAPVARTDSGPLRVAVPFEVSEASVLLRRACHAPAPCAANASDVPLQLAPLSAWRRLGDAKLTSVSATGAIGTDDDGSGRGRSGGGAAAAAAAARGGGASGGGEALELVGGKGSAGSAFTTDMLDASAGLRVRFRYRLKRRSCHVACGAHAGGLALVLASAPPDAPPARGGPECRATLTPQDARLPSVSPLQVHTLVSCAGYRGIGASVGVAISIDNSRLVPLDPSRGAAAVFVDGNVTDGGSGSGSSRAYAQLEHAAGRELLETEHEALVVWQAQAQILYLFVDGEQEPSLFASLTLPDARWERARTFVGFTAESALDMDITVWNVSVSVPAPAASTSMLSPDSLQLLTACELNSVRLDPRDSCGFPILQRSRDEGWRVRVDRVDTEDVGQGHVVSVRAQDDGTLIINFRVDAAGNYTVRGAPADGGFGAASAANEELAHLGTIEVRPCMRPNAPADWSGWASV